ncbi:MAG: F0F1 ATP synthase subunit A, partial [Rickettsiales bacterium]|nr:F0F1 ATP synthase subunit A [Rickettsiales bacterium]
TAGHVLLKVLAGLVAATAASGSVGVNLVGILPFLFIVLMTGFEIFIAMLQAYIFSILTCVYLSEAVGDH